MQSKTYFKLIVFILCFGVVALFATPVFAVDPPAGAADALGAALGASGSGAEPVAATGGSSGGELLRKGLKTSSEKAGLVPKTTTSIQGVVGIVIKEALKYLSILFIILMLYAGIRWMTASGDSSKVKEARSWIINATIGFIVTLMAYQVVTFIIKSIEITGSSGASEAPVAAEVSEEAVYTAPPPEKSLIPEE